MLRVIAPGFMQDLAGLIEQNRRRSMAKSRILRLRPGQRRREDGMRAWNIYLRTSSKFILLTTAQNLHSSMTQICNLSEKQQGCRSIPFNNNAVKSDEKDRYEFHAGLAPKLLKLYNGIRMFRFGQVLAIAGKWIECGKPAIGDDRE